MDALPLCFPVTIRDASGGTSRIHTHDFHEIVCVCGGTGLQVTDRARYPVRPGQIYVFPAGVPHGAYAGDGGEQMLQVLYVPESWFAASVWERDLADAWERLVSRCAAESLVDLGDDPSAGGEARELFGRMVREFAEKRPGYLAAVHALFCELVLAVMRSRWWEIRMPRPQVQRSPRRLIREAESYIRASWYREIHVEEMLAVCNLSRSHFHALFKRFTGRTFVDYVQAIRVEHAREALVTSDDRVSDVADACGFSSAAYFATVFRELTGVSPSEYRQQHALEGATA